MVGQTQVVFSVPESARGRNGDFPVPFVVFSVDIDEQAQVATDARYVFVSREYGRIISRDVDNVVGRSYLEVSEGDKDAWLSRCYRVVALGETVSDFAYDPLVRGWICFNLAPSAVDGCCVYTLVRVSVDDQQRKQLMASTDARTSHFISEMLSELAAEQDHGAAMNSMLAKMSEVVHADRLSVFECSGDETTTTFELLAPGVESQLGASFPATRKVLEFWFRNVTHDRVVLVPNVSVIQRVSEPLYRWCVASNVQSLLAAPFYSGGEIVGFLGAYNYQIDDVVDLNRLFEAVSTFIAARLENRQLINSLRQASSHDMLTGLLNRRGSQQAIREQLLASPHGHFALALLDVDDFKRVNDVYGHDAGDEALRQMSRTLRRTFPREAILSRNGGDEFLVMLSGDSARNVDDLLTGLTVDGLSFTYEGEQHQYSISAGYALYPEQADNVRELLCKADAALYAVKLSGKAGYKKYASGTEDGTRMRLGFSLQDVLESAPYALMVSRANDQGEILFASSELAHMLGYDSMYEFMRTTGGSYAEIVSPGERERVRRTIERLGNGGGGDPRGTFDFFAQTKDGQEMAVRANFRFVDIDDSGRVVYTLFYNV